MAALVVLCAGVLTALVASGLRSDGPRSRGEPAPPIDLELIGRPGATWTLADQRGVPVLVNFWASWCAPCRVEMPDIDALVAGSGGALRAVGVNVLDRAESAEAFAGEIAVGYPLVRDATGSVATAYTVTAVPYTVVVDASGTIVARASGRPDAAALERLVTGALGPDWRSAAAVGP